MKRLSVLVMILFVSACGDGQAEQSEADSQEETASTEKQSNDELTELEKENEELRKELAEKEKEEAEENTASEADKAEDSEGEAASQNDQNDNMKTAAVEEETAELAVKEFTMEEQQEMTQHFYDWAIERAEIGNMAVTNMYFSHGAAGRGDWYAMTPDGEVQTQNQDNPGFDHFDIHAVGGVAFYQPASGDFGEDADAPFPGTAEGYSRLALPDTNIHKYMLADNGVVYELIGKKENMSFSSGFGEYDDEGTYGEYPPGSEFEISGDQDAQQEWKRILRMYQR